MTMQSIKWGVGREQHCINWLDAEMTNALAVHDSLVATWIRWLELYRAPVKQPTRRVPVEGAANFMLPIIASDADPLYAKFIQSLHATEDVWTLTALNERWVDAAKPLQDFLTWLDTNLLHMYDVNKRVVSEMVKLGTGIYKTGWHYEKRPIYTYDDQGKVIRAEKIKGAPFVDHVRLSDFLFPPTAYSIDPDAQGGAQWVAERLRVKVDRLKWLAESSDPMLPNVAKDVLAKIIKFEESGVTDYDAAIQQQDYVKAASGAVANLDTGMTTPSGLATGISSAIGTTRIREIELWEVHARFATGVNDSEDDVVLWYHKPTRLFVRGVYQYYHHGKRPYEVVRYFPGDGFYGIGVCEQTEMFQLAESDLFNFTHDNVLLANSRMVVASSGTNIAPGEPFYPQKVWVVDGDVRQSFGIFPMADIYTSLPLLGESLAQKRERRNGMGDLQAGQLQSLPSRTPATTTLSLLQEGQRRPDLTLKDMKYSGLSIVGLRLLQLCQQYMTSPVDVGGKALLKMMVEMLGQPEGEAAARAIVMPAENVETGIGCAISATSGSQNKETKKQDYLALMQIANQTTQSLVGLAQMATQFAGTPVAAMAQAGIGAQLELGNRLLEAYDIQNRDRIIPDPSMAQAAGQTSAAGQNPAQAGGGPVPAGANGGPSALAGPTQFDPSVAELYGGAQHGVRV